MCFKGDTINIFAKGNGMEIKPKLEIKAKGESVNLPTVKQLKIQLGWSTETDLDLMAFYEKKGGGVGAVYSDEISKDVKSLGDLNAFPFILLDGDAGVDKAAGEKVETMLVTNLDEITKLYLVALNYTAAAEKNVTADRKSVV